MLSRQTVRVALGDAVEHKHLDRVTHGGLHRSKRHASLFSSCSLLSRFATNVVHTIADSACKTSRLSKQPGYAIGEHMPVL